MTIAYPFTEEDARQAYDEWGCNCGPTALAFALQISLDQVRPAIPDFESRRYTSPTMMAAAIANLGRSFEAVRSPHGGRNRSVSLANMFAGPVSLVRIQWTGPWTASGMSQRWASRQTHWIACWIADEHHMVFDCNGGMQLFAEWERVIVPAIVATIPRADGGWFPANVWRLSPN